MIGRRSMGAFEESAACCPCNVAAPVRRYFRLRDVLLVADSSAVVGYVAIGQKTTLMNCTPFGIRLVAPR